MGSEHKEHTWSLVAKKLSGEATPEELNELEELLRNNPELHYPMQTIMDLWGPSGPADRWTAEQAFNRHLDRMEELNIGMPKQEEEIVFPGPGDVPLFRRPAVRRALLTAAAALASALVITTVYLSRRQEAAAVTTVSQLRPPALPSNTIFTGSGSRTHLTLPDGTRVWLNAGSRINYEKNYGAALREVDLTGEAFFDVAHDAGKPFIIHTSRIDIRVLGTSFNVKSYPAERTTEATLVSGSIEVLIRNRPADKIIMRPNEKLIVSGGDSLKTPADARHGDSVDAGAIRLAKPTYLPHSGTPIETSWVNNKLVFQDEPFSDLAIRMERWYGVTIHFDNDRLKDLHFTGIFEKETIQQALDALRFSTSFNYTVEGSLIKIHD